MVKRLLKRIPLHACALLGLTAAVFCYSLPALSQGCGVYLEVQQGAIKRYKDAEIFMVEVPKYNYLFQGTLSDRGTLDITAYLSFSEFGVRSHLRGSELYREMIEHFGVERIKKIKGAWLEGTNYERFFELYNSGYSKEDAASMTWSGRQAAKYGFNRVGRVEIQKNRNLNMTSVYVEFLKTP